MGMGVRGEPRPGGPVPKGCMAAKAQGFSVPGRVRVCVCVCLCVCASLHNSVSERICVQGWESWVFVCSGRGGCVSELGGMARAGGQL